MLLFSILLSEIIELLSEAAFAAELFRSSFHSIIVKKGLSLHSPLLLKPVKMLYLIQTVNLADELLHLPQILPVPPSLPFCISFLKLVGDICFICRNAFVNTSGS